MTFLRVRIACLSGSLALLCLASLAPWANAQGQVTPASATYINSGSSGVAAAGDFSGSYLFGNDGGTYLLFDKLIGDGPGYDVGHTRIGLRAKVYDMGDAHLWAAGTALIGDDSRVGVNLGGGYRWLFDGNILGIHGWYDSYETNYGNRYTQASVGLELLHEEVDFRVNGYLPFGEEETFLGITDQGTTPAFGGRGVHFLGRGNEEQALKGIDAEVGTAIFALPWARVYAGAYFYDGKSTNFGGGRARIETAISPDLSLNFVVQNDSEFDTNYNMNVEYRFSGGVPMPTFSPFHGENRKYNAVRRQTAIATQVVNVPVDVPMMHVPMNGMASALPGGTPTGRALIAAFVDNTNPDAGDGSYENPYRSLPATDSADMVFVFAGAGATTGNIRLRNGQQLLGEGKLYTLRDPLRGDVPLPSSFRSTGPRPILSAANPAQNIVTLASNNRVANFDLFAGAAAIGGVNIDGFELDMVTVRTGTDGVVIRNASGRGLIRNSGFIATDRAVSVTNVTGSPLDVVLETVGVIGAAEGVRIAADGADVNSRINNYSYQDGTGVGLILDASLGATHVTDVSQVTVGNADNIPVGVLPSTGVELNVDSGGRLAITMAGLTVDGSGDLFAANVRNGRLDGRINGAGLSNSRTGSGVALNLNDATGRLIFNGLFANRNAINGIATIATGDDTNYRVDVINSQLIASGDSAFFTDVTDGADMRYFVDPTFATLSGGSGFEYNVEGPGSTFVADILETDFTDSTLHAIDGRVFNGAIANVDLFRTPGINAGLDGYRLEVDRNSRFTGTIDESDFNFAGDAAINLAVTDGSIANLTITDSNGFDNGNDGLRFFVDGGVNGGSRLMLDVTNGDFSRNPDSNIVGLTRGAGSRTTLNFQSVTADAFANLGAVVLGAEDGGAINANWNLGSISQSNATGLTANVDGPRSQIRLDLTGVSIRTNGGNGIDATLTNGGVGSVLDLTLVNSTVSLNQGTGIDLAIDGPGAMSQVTIDNTSVGGNFTGDGFEFDVTGGASLIAMAFGPGSHFAGNGQRAWDGSVSGAGSTAAISFDGTDGSASGLEGGVFDVSTGGLLNLTLSNLSVSNNPLDGILTTVDGAGSQANLVFNQVNLIHNGLSLFGDGFEARATNGGVIDAMLTNMTVTENRENGFLFDASTGGQITTRLDGVTGDGNGRQGLQFNVASGGSFDGTVTSSSFSNNGSVFLGNGILGNTDGAGSVGSIMLNGVTADNNSRHGFAFNASGGSSLTADIRSTVAAGASSASGNAVNGVRVNATDADTMAFLKMMGANTFDNNGADGINFDAVGVDMAVAQVTGTVNNNGADGINVRMVNVTSGAISLQGLAPATISGNADDGIDITTQNVSLVDKTVDGMLIPAFQIDGFTFSGNGDQAIALDLQNTNITGGRITNNIIDGGVDGINVNWGTGLGDLTIDGNTISDTTRYGIAVTSDAGTHNIAITNNTVTSSGDTNVFVDIFGTSETGLMIDNNTIIGGGTGQATFTVGTNFTGMTFTQAQALGTASIPPDTMGAVGPDHIIEFVNQGVTIFNKDGSIAVPTMSLDAFWLAAGLPDVSNGTFDPRIIYDPTVNRWFVAAIDSVATGANNIYIGVSINSDPTAGFRGIRFVGDSVDDARFNDFETLGIDADGVYLATNNFGGPSGFDVAVFSIPKADLLGAVLSVANLSRFEGLNSQIFGATLQPTIDFGPSDGVAQFIGTLFPGGSTVQRTDLTGGGTPTATLGATVNVTTPFYTQSPGGRQPNGGLLPLVPPSPRFSGNVIEIGDSLWAVQDVQGTAGVNGAVRWYEIDVNTNTVLQTGLIEDPNLDFIASSINVNQAGAVVIGFTGSGPGQFASSMAAFGSTDGAGATSFQTPTVLAAGVDNYQITFGGTRNRWGDYSATVVDPTDPNKFWTFQELVVGPNDYGVQITEINFTQAVFGGTPGDGIHVNVRETARLTASTINGNTINSHGGDGIEVLVNDTAQVDSLAINGNTVTSNGGDAIRFENTSTGTMGNLDINNNTDISGNTGDGIDVVINGVTGAPQIMVNGNTVADNLGRGIAVSAIDTAVSDVSISLNTVTNNLGGNGITLDLGNMTGGLLPAGDVLMIGNNVTGSAGDGANINLRDRTGINLLDVSMSNFSQNAGGGVIVTADNTPIGTMLFDLNTIVDNTGGDGLLLDMTDSAVGTLTISQSSISTNTGEGVELDLDGSPIGVLNVVNNNTGGTVANIGLTFLIDGNTFTSPFSILNSSGAGTDIVGFMLDISTADPNLPAGLFFDTTGAGGPTPFQPQGNSDVTTGLLTVNGNAITPGTNPLQDAMGNVLVGGGVADGSQLLDLTFGDFNSTESFQWNIDLDPSPTMTGAVFGDQLVGAMIRADFSGGQFLTGALIGVPGNPDASTFVATGGTPTGAPGISGNLGTGFLLNATNGSNIGAMTFDGNVVDGNLTHGIDLNVSDSTLPAVGGTGIVSNNQISGHNNGDGFRLINPDTNGTPFQLDFVDNTITDNTGGIGINVELNTNSGGMTSVATGNTISNNGSFGASFVTADDATLDLTFGDSTANANTLIGNVDAGLAIKTKDMSTATIVVENTAISGTVDGPNAAFNGDGLAVHSSESSIVTSLTIGDDTLQNTSFSSNAGNGIDIRVTDTARNPNILIQNVTANTNVAHGIGLVRTGFASFSEDLDSDGILDPGEDVNGDGLLGNAVITMTTANGNGTDPLDTIQGAGLDVSISGAGLPVQQIDVIMNQNSFSNNEIGMNFVTNNNAILLVNAANNVVDGNSSHGINVTTNQSSAFGNVLPSGGDPASPLAIPSTFSSNIVTNNGGNGLNFIANDSSVQSITVDDAGAVNPSTGTSATVIDGNAGNQVQMTGNGNSQQSINLSAVQITNVNGATTGNGVNIDATGNSMQTVNITGGVAGPAIIGANIAHVSVPGLGGPGGVANAINVNVSNQAFLTLNVTDVNIFNNTGDAINIRNNGPAVGTSGVAQQQSIQATFDNITARLNGDQGLDVVLNGNTGGRAAQGDTDIPVLIDVMNSNFSSNANEGIFFQAGAGFTNAVGNLYADLVADFNVRNSIIQTNGSANLTDGLVMRVGTNSYVLSTIFDNVFGANGLDDFHTESFGAGPNTAQLDLLFQENAGDHIRPSAFGATAGTERFILDNALTVEPNNNFQTFGNPQMEVFGPDGFGTNGYILRPNSNHGDPLFP